MNFLDAVAKYLSKLVHTPPTNIRLVVYVTASLVISLMGKVVPHPSTAGLFGALVDKHNVINEYGVKEAWKNNMLLIIPFVLVTWTVFGENKYGNMVRPAGRLVICTIGWYCSRYVFKLVQERVNPAMDISGHCMILSLSSGMIVDETRVMIGWLKTEKLISDERQRRANVGSTLPRNIYSDMSDNSLNTLGRLYSFYLPIACILYALLALLQLTWDFMFLLTLLFFHEPVEKFLGSLYGVVVAGVVYNAPLPGFQAYEKTLQSI